LIDTGFPANRTGLEKELENAGCGGFLAWRVEFKRF
jgi:hypothetical protein